MSSAEERRGEHNRGCWLVVPNQELDAPRSDPNMKNVGEAACLCFSVARGTGYRTVERSCSNTDTLAHVWGFLYTRWTARAKHPKAATWSSETNMYPGTGLGPGRALGADTSSDRWIKEESTPVPFQHLPTLPALFSAKVLTHQ